MESNLKATVGTQHAASTFGSFFGKIDISETSFTKVKKWALDGKD